MRLIAYIRVSSTGQLDAYGPDAQRADMARWAKANGHKIVGEYVDSITGKSDSVEREGLTDALEALNGADGLLVGRLDRLARQLTVQEAILAMLWRDGHRAFAADQGEILQDDVDDPMRTALRQVQGVFAQLDRAMVTKRLRDGRRVKARTGRHAVGEYPYGYHGEGKGRARDAAPEPAEQAAVRRIVELRGAGESFRSIASTLDAEGHRPRRAAAWSAMSVRGVVLRASAEKVSFDLR
ncbi:recombinase family protein [Saccharothrix sp. NRRL B-16314]|uniref:recombinase family protein n=1 Tax=Saccharothrix sp. NRRL B-16314 TaxID=1463825 RepID=UPI0005246F06|nr:recombinase family protein [Saccharothrix sp. NRRL B-16314]